MWIFGTQDNNVWGDNLGEASGRFGRVNRSKSAWSIKTHVVNVSHQCTDVPCCHGSWPLFNQVQIFLDWLVKAAVVGLVETEYIPSSGNPNVFQRVEELSAIWIQGKSVHSLSTCQDQDGSSWEQAISCRNNGLSVLQKRWFIDFGIRLFLIFERSREKGVRERL